MKQKIIKVLKVLFKSNYSNRNWIGDNNNKLGV